MGLLETKSLGACQGKIAYIIPEQTQLQQDPQFHTTHCSLSNNHQYLTN